MDAVLVRNADRMMMIANLLRDGVELRFADGRKGLVPFADIPEIKERAGLADLELPNPYEMVLTTAQGERVEIPWDFARHYCDESYRPTVEALAMRGRKTLGERIRTFRESAGLSQEALATAADIRTGYACPPRERKPSPQIQDADGHRPSPRTTRPSLARRTGAFAAVDAATRS